MNVEEIHERIKDVKTWDHSDERRMSLDALGRMLMARMGQVSFKKGIYLDDEGLRLPNLGDKLWHFIGFHFWLEYDDNNVFDATRRLCLICEASESSPMRRDLAYYQPCGGGLILAEVLAYIREVKRK